jgi:hypothetical protein
MKHLSGLIIAVVMAVNLAGCADQEKKPMGFKFSKEATLVAMEPISIEKSVGGDYVRFREVDGSCQYSGKLEKNADSWAAEIDESQCFSGLYESRAHRVKAFIGLGKLKADVAKNSQVNVAFVLFDGSY